MSRHAFLRILPLALLSIPITTSLSLQNPHHHDLNRRAAIKTAGASVPFLASSLLLASGGTASIPAAAAAADVTKTIDLTVPRTASVIVLGAGGGTGRACVSSVLSSGRRCVATNRRGDFVYSPPTDGVGSSAPAPTNALKTAAADVTSYESLSTLLSSAKDDVGAVIFAASASAKGGDAQAVDRDGVINAARACIENDVARLVVVSSGAVTRPDSAVYKLLNLVGKGIMEAKIEGEDEVRRLYASEEVLGKRLGYTIIRPGGLTNEERVGAAGLELNQGDGKSGRLSRLDVASLCVECLDYSAAFDTTFECYEALTAKPLESVGLSNILKQKDPTGFKSGRECRGETWGQLFQGLEKDGGIVV